MTRPYSSDLRRRVVEAVEAGSSCSAVAARCAVSVSFVIKLMQRWRRTGSIAPDRYGGWTRSTVLVHAGRVRALLEAAPDLTLGELQVRLAADGITVSPAALHRFLSADGLTQKKRRSMPPNRTRADVAAARLAWRARQPALRTEHLVFRAHVAIGR